MINCAVGGSAKSLHFTFHAETTPLQQQWRFAGFNCDLSPSLFISRCRSMALREHFETLNLAKKERNFAPRI